MPPFHDGAALFEVPEGYPESRDKNLDTFDSALYENVRSVSDAVTHIKANYSIDNDVAAMHAVFDFTKQRFIHRMYPIHNWLTNPLYTLFELYDPLNSFNEMSTANELLRHSAVGGCGDTSVTAIEIYRALGYEAQYVSLDGHHVGEFKAGGKKWLVDADMEVIAPYSIAEIQSNLDLVNDIYSAYPERRQKLMKKIFSRKILHANGFSGAPRYGDYMYNLHSLIEKVKWLLPLTGIVLSVFILVILRRVATTSAKNMLFKQQT